MTPFNTTIPVENGSTKPFVRVYRIAVRMRINFNPTTRGAGGEWLEESAVTISEIKIKLTS